MTAKERLLRMVEDLPETHVPVAAATIASLRAAEDPRRWAANHAPWDVEGEDSDAEKSAVAEAREQLARGERVSLETMEREFGLR